MPKKFSVNEKQEKGRGQKASAAAVKELAKREAAERAEEASWKDGAKKPYPKILEEQLKKEHRQALKQERDALLQRELAEIVPEGPKPPVRASILSSKAPSLRSPSPIMDRLAATSPDVYSASSVDDAIDMLTTISASPSSFSALLDRHPERRVRAAYAEFEEKELPSLKKEYPCLRLAQLKQLLWKKFSKSHDNPLNRPHLAYDVKEKDVESLSRQLAESTLESYRKNI